MAEIKGEYTFLPKALFAEISEEIERKAQFNDKKAIFFQTCASMEKIRKFSEENIFIKPEAFKVLKKLYDAPNELPF